MMAEAAGIYLDYSKNRVTAEGKTPWSTKVDLTDPGMIVAACASALRARASWSAPSPRSRSSIRSRTQSRKSVAT